MSCLQAGALKHYTTLQVCLIPLRTWMSLHTYPPLHPADTLFTEPPAGNLPSHLAFLHEYKHSSKPGSYTSHCKFIILIIFWYKKEYKSMTLNTEI